VAACEHLRRHRRTDTGVTGPRDLATTRETTRGDATRTHDPGAAAERPSIETPSGNRRSDVRRHCTRDPAGRSSQSGCWVSPGVGVRCRRCEWGGARLRAATRASLAGRPHRDDMTRPRASRLGIGAVVAFACGVSVTSVSACASLSGLTGGGDASVDAVTDGVSDVRDATTQDAREAGTLDAADHAVADASVDAARDPLDGSHAPTDADSRADADAEALAKPDAASDALPDGCVPYRIPDAGVAPACAVHDANACNPNTPGFVPVWRPPLRKIACTAPQVIEYVAACFGPGASDATCASFTEDPMNAACYQCMFTNDRTASNLGPIINESGIGVLYTNEPGCLALVDPCEIDCAKALDAARQCLEDACSNCERATSDWYACQTEAEGCSCLPYQNAAAACTSALASRPADRNCFVGTEFAPIAQSYGIYFCAGGPLVFDAGADGG